MIHIKYCKKCGEAFDIDTSKDLCPKCRRDINRNERRLEEDEWKN